MMFAMTIKDAGTKWCPYYRVAVEGNDNTYPVTNRLEDFGNSPYCINERCMKWEWVDGTKRKGYCGA